MLQVQTETKMASVSPLILFLLGAMIHVCTAIQCYQCATEYKDDCDDPLDTSKVPKSTCPSDKNACAKMKGTAKRENISLYLYVESTRVGLYSGASIRPPDPQSSFMPPINPVRSTPLPILDFESCDRVSGSWSLAVKVVGL